MYSTVETRYTWFSSFRNVSRASGRKRRGHGGCCANANTSTRRENRMSHTFRNPGHFRFPSKTDLARTRIRHHPLIVDGGRSNTKRQTWRNWSLKPDAKKKKKKPPRPLYMATKIIDPPSIYVIVQISPREKCALPNEPPDRENNRGLGP